MCCLIPCWRRWVCIVCQSSLLSFFPSVSLEMCTLVILFFYVVLLNASTNFLTMKKPWVVTKQQNHPFSLSVGCLTVTEREILIPRCILNLYIKTFFLLSYNLALKQSLDANHFNKFFFQGLSQLPLKSVEVFEFTESQQRPLHYKPHLVDWI